MSDTDRLAAFLRGINLGNRRLTNDRLREVVEGAGLDGVAVYQAAGNIVFDDPGRAPDAVERELERHFQSSLGYDVDTFIRTLRELDAIASWGEGEAAGADGFKGHVLFLREAPDASLTDHLSGLETPDDRFRLRGREILWLRRGGLSNATIAPFGAAGITRGETGTMRTLGTVRRMVKKFG
jgi:uncharacterized protein (DUF1697 family)